MSVNLILHENRKRFQRAAPSLMEWLVEHKLSPTGLFIVFIIGPLQQQQQQQQQQHSLLGTSFIQ